MTNDPNGSRSFVSAKKRKGGIVIFAVGELLSGSKRIVLGMAILILVMLHGSSGDEGKTAVA